MAFAECGGIVSESGHCPICVQPQLQIAEGATLRGSVGGSVAVPFELVNGSQVDRPLFVKSLWSREGGDWREERLGWEKLASGARASASVTACEIERPGLHEVEILWTVGTRWKTREEQFAYSTSVFLEVPDTQHQPNSNIQINGENQQGNVIQIKVPDGGGAGIERVVTAIDMKVERQDREERRLKLRSIDGMQFVSRAAQFEFHGFPEGHAPPAAQPIVTPDAMLKFGRGYSRAEGGDTDVRLLATGADGSLDEAGSRVISRRHFEVYVENDRPVLHVAGGNGLRVNNTSYSVDDLITLQPGDVISPIQDRPDALSLHVTMRRERDRISRVIFTRRPALAGQ
ncbi:MAG: FHA domain-containing protein [Pseudomonadota bacterium]